MRFIVLLFPLCVGLVCSTPAERENVRDIEYVDPVDSRREPEVRDTEDSYGDGPQRRFPVFRPIGGDDDDDDDGGFDSDDGFFYNYPPRPSFPSNDFYLRRFQQQWDQMRRLNELLMRWFSFGRPIARPQFPPGFFGFNDFGNFSDLPPNYDNSTYTTKNINGTIVAVNETIRRVENNDSSFVFHVKTVQVRPENETAGSDDGITVVEAGEEADFGGEGGQGSASSTAEGPVETTSSPDFSPVATTESADGVNTSPGDAPEDPSSNDVNLARRFRRHALAR